jgi:hypothetical protein
VNRRHRANGAGHAVARDGDERSVVGDPLAVDAAGDDIDAQELAALDIPARPFAEH